MKLRILTTIAAISCSLACEAQTNAPSTNQVSVPASTLPAAGTLSTNANPFTMIYGYFTSFNTNLTATFATNNDYQVWMGASYSASVFLGGTLGEEVQPFSGLHGLTFRGVETLAPQVGTLADVEVDVGYAFSYIDTRSLFFVGGDLANKNGSQNQPESGSFSFGAEFEKAIAPNAFSGIYLEGRTRTKGALLVGVNTGVTF